MDQLPENSGDSAAPACDPATVDETSPNSELKRENSLLDSIPFSDLQPEQEDHHVENLDTTISCPESFSDDVVEKCCESIEPVSDSEAKLRQATYTLEEVEGEEEEDATKLSEMTDSSKSMICYKDTATWTAEDGMPSPLDSNSPLDSPSHEALITSHDISDFNLGSLDAEEILNMIEARGGDMVPPPPQFENAPYSKSHKRRHHHHHSYGHSRHRSKEEQQMSDSVPKLCNRDFQPCFTVSSHLMGRETRLYENVPRNPGELEQLGALLNDIPPAGGGDELLTGRMLIRPNHPGKQSRAELLNVTDLIMGNNNSNNTTSSAAGPGSSRNSWADSGRESLSFDGEACGHNGGGGSSSNGSSKNIMLYPAPMMPTTTSGCVTTSSSFCYIAGQNQTPFLNAPSPPPHRGGNIPSSKRHKRDRHLVRQKHVVDEPDRSGGGKEDDIKFGHVYIPSPRRAVPSTGPDLGPPSVAHFAAASPINLQRHPNAAQMMIQENKRTRPLIPCESPYIISPGEQGNGSYYFPKGRKSPSRGSEHGHGDRSRDNHSKLEYFLHPKPAKSHRNSSTSGRHHTSFDYGELPSHQMFPKRHLLHQGVRHFSQHHFPKDNSSEVTTGGGGGNQPNSSAFQPNSLLHQPQNNLQHRSFPAGLLSGIAPRSCSMGDLASGNNSNLGTASKSPEPLPPGASAHHGGYNPNNMPLVASLPLPPAASVTYEFSLAPVSGSLAPGWHLTAVQRGLANAVPLAAAVARRRMPRPRTSTRHRFGFTDKNEARRAKWTIVVTALALLAMSMLLVGVTLRLAPLIDDLVRRENDKLLKDIHQPAASLNETAMEIGGGASIVTTAASENKNSSYSSNDNIASLDDDENPAETNNHHGVNNNFTEPIALQSKPLSSYFRTTSSPKNKGLVGEDVLPPPKAQSLIMSMLTLNLDVSHRNATTIQTRTTSPQAPPTLTPYFTHPISSVSSSVAAVTAAQLLSSKEPPSLLVNETISPDKAIVAAGTQPPRRLQSQRRRNAATRSPYESSD